MFAGSAVLIFETPPKRALVSDCHAVNSSSEDMFNTGLFAWFHAKLCMVVPGGS